MKQKLLQAMFAVLLIANANAQVNSGSNGSDGALNPVSSIVINMGDHPNGIYQYSSVTISNGVTVTFTPNANNTPVTWLVQSNVVINGTVDVSGQNVNNAAGGLAGPGGWAGGNGGVGNGYASSGFGPGGGVAGYNSTPTNAFLAGQASFGTLGSQAGPSNGGYWLGQASPGIIYGNNFLIPLVGGSGGGGDGGSGGGGGGGALLIAANGSIIVNGSIMANGGSGYWCNYGNCYGNGAGGSGGALRLVAALISGGGQIVANGGTGVSGYGLYYPNTDSAGNGRIRLDTYENNFSGQIYGAYTQGSQFIITPSSAQLPQLTVTSVGGVPVSASPTGILTTPDAVLSAQQNNPIPIVVSCANLPLSTQITVSVKPANGAAVSATGLNNTGTLSSSTATISIVIPRGGGLIYATAATSN